MSNVVISVEHIQKTFHLKEKTPGMSGSFRSLLWPKYRPVDAVKDVSFSIQKGQSVALIGPNGAGKSTIIKMLSGILVPSAGSMHVAGYVPFQDRTKLAYKIGTVFGQKSQLSYHLPAYDSFYLLSQLYDVPTNYFKERLAWLANAFDIGSLYQVPVRKLSLGQRMRCELVASLLHRPSILFLDEPTIGLDIIAKQQVRDILGMLNRDEGLTLILTSHDVGDIEAISTHTILINHGSVVFDGFTHHLSHDFCTKKIIQLVLEQQLASCNIPGTELLECKGHVVRLLVENTPEIIQRVLAHAFSHFTVRDVTIQAIPLEHIITQLYQRQKP